jgi:hypothetical protein
MSLAAFRLDSPKIDSITLHGVAEHEALQALASIPLSITIKPVIAIDLDDVLSQTNRAVAECKCASLARRLNYI